MLGDIAALTGGTVISEEVGIDLKDTTLDMLGRARSVRVEKELTIITDGAGNKEDIEGLSLIHICLIICRTVKYSVQ